MKNKGLLLTALFALAPLAANANVITLTGPGAMDADTDPATIVSLTTTETGTILDLDFFIDLDEDTGCCGYDFTIELTHVDTGSSATIWTTGFQTGWSFGSVRDTTFDDESPNVFFDTTLRDTDGFDILPGQTFQAEDLLSVFDGESLFGTWELSLLDVDVPGEGDDLLSWGIIVTTADVPAPGALVLLSLGLIGGGLARRRRIA